MSEELVTPVDYGALLAERDKQAAGRVGMALTMDPRTPEQAATDQQAGDALGLPAGRVALLRDHYGALLRQKETTETLTQAPALRRWIEDDPQNGALAKDDLRELSNLEGWGNAISAAGDRLRAIPPALRSMSDASLMAARGKTVDQLLDEMAPPTVRATMPDFMRASLAERARELHAMAQAADVGAITARQADDLRAVGAAVEAEAGKPYSGPATRFMAALDTAGPMDAPAILQVLADDPDGALALVFESLLRSSPSLIAGSLTTLATRNPALGMAVGGATSTATETSLSTAQFLQEAKHDITTPEGVQALLADPDALREAQARGLTRGLVVGIVDTLSFGVAGQRLSGSPMGDVLLQGVAQAIFGGGGEFLAQQASGQQIDLREVIIEALAEVPGSVVETFGVAGRGLLKDGARAATAGTAADAIRQVDALAAQSKLKQRSPGKFAEFLARTGLGEAVYVPAGELQTFYQARDVDAAEIVAALGGDVAEYQEQLLAGGKVAIPLSGYAARPEALDGDADWWAENASFNADDMSLADAAAFNAEVRDIMDEARAEMEARAQDDLETRAGDAQVYDAMLSQLRGAGRSLDVATREAQLWTAFFRTMAARYGDDALELARRFGVRVEGPAAPEAGRRRGALDMSLNALRRRRGGARPKGARLSRFVADAGGVIDAGGDVAQMEGVRGLVAMTSRDVEAARAQGVMGLGGDAQGRGVSLDEMARRALEAGYLRDVEGAAGMLAGAPGEDFDLVGPFLEALRRDVAGEAVYAEGEGTSDPAFLRAADLDALEAELEARGVDFMALDNDAVVAVLEAQDGETLEQAAALEIDPDTPVMVVEAPPVDAGDDARTTARRVYREMQRGRDATSPDGTLVKMTAAGEGKAFSRSADMGARVRIAAVLGDLIASAPIYGMEPDRGGRPGLSFANAAGAVRIDGEVRAVRLIYRVGEQSGAAFYEFQGYEIADPARSGGARADDSAPLAGQPLTGSAVRIGDLVAAFNGPVLFQGAVPDPRESLRRYSGGKSQTSPGFTDLSRHAAASALLDDVAGAPSLVEATQAADRWVLGRGRATGVEHLVVLDKDGGLVSVGRGSKGAVSFSDMLLEAGDSGVVSYLTHNHPRNSGLSDADIAMASRFKAQATAMGHAGAMVSALPGPALAGRGMSWGDIIKALSTIDAPVRQHLQEMVNRREVSVDTAIAVHSHIVDIQRHRLGIIDLRSNGYDIAVAAGVDVDAILAATEGDMLNAARRAGLDVADIRDRGGDGAPGGIAIPQRDRGDVAASLSAGDGQARARSRGPVPSRDPRQLRLLQGAEAAPRGSITFPAGGLERGETLIRLMEGADLSTFIHEGGHFFLEAFRTLAAMDGAPQALRDDLAVIHKFLGVSDGATGYTVEQQEKWARGFEAYAMEGRAPSLELADAFSRFKAWLTRIYKTLRGLNVTLTDEVRGVMDRMLATDAEIAAMRDAEGMRPLFANPADAGMSAEAFAPYQRMAQRAVSQAEATLLERTMAAVRRRREAWWRAETKDVRAEVEAEYRTRREYRLVDFLANQMANGEAVADDLRLDRDALVAQFGAGVLAEIDRSRLGGKRAIYAKGGADPMTVADLFGFRTVDDMIAALQNAGKFKDAVAGETERRLVERHGDPLSDGSIEEEALAAIHSEQQAKTVSAEARQLARRAGRDPRTITTRVFRQRARMMLGRMRVSEASKPAGFLQAERQARRGAEKAFAKVVAAGERNSADAEKHLATALRFKEQELLNHMLYMESRDFAEKAKKAREKMRDYARPKVRAAIGPDYIGQIDALLEGYEFRARSGKQVARAESLKAFADRMVAEGKGGQLFVSQKLLDEAQRTHFSRMSVEDFQGLIDTVANLDHMGRFKQKLIDARGARDYEASVTALVEGIRKNLGDGKGGGAFDNPADDRAVARRDLLVNMLNADTLLREIDGLEALGPAYTELKQAIDEGVAALRVMERDAADKVEAIYGVYSDAEMRSLHIKRRLDGVREPVSKADALSLALNWGNDDNRAAVLDAGSLSRDEVETILGTLDKRDWDFVQASWDFIDSFWPQIEAVEARLTGVKPRKVQAQAFTTAHGVMRGGYYPLKYDASKDGRARDETIEDLMAAQATGAFGKAATKNGFAKERVGSGGRPIRFGLDVMATHVQQVVRHIALAEAVANTNRLLSSGRVKQAFIAAGRSADHGALEAWLRDTAVGEVGAVGAVSKIARSLRAGLSVSAMGFNLWTTALQFTGLFQSAVVIGKGPMLRGMGRMMATFADPSASIEEAVYARSQMMADRAVAFNKDIRDALRDAQDGLRVSDDKPRVRIVPRWVQQNAFWLIVKAQRFVDVATWMGAYESGMAQFGGDETQAARFADRMVERAQGSPDLSGRTAIERGTLTGFGRMETQQSEFVKAFTPFMSYMLAKFNIAYERGLRLGRNMDSPAEWVGFITDMALLFTVEAFVIALIRGELPDEDDEDKTVAGYLAAETGYAMLGTVPFVRDIAATMKGFGGGSAVTRGMETFGGLAAQVNQGEVDAAMVKALNSTGGLILKYPSSQMNRFIDAAWRDAEGEDVAPIEYLIRVEKKD